MTHTPNVRGGKAMLTINHGGLKLPLKTKKSGICVDTLIFPESQRPEI